MIGVLTGDLSNFEQHVTYFTFTPGTICSKNYVWTNSARTTTESDTLLNIWGPQFDGQFHLHVEGHSTHNGASSLTI